MCTVNVYHSVHCSVHRPVSFTVRDCTAVAVGVIQWRGLDHIPGSGDIWGLVISHKTGVDKHLRSCVLISLNARVDKHLGSCVHISLRAGVDKHLRGQ